MDAYLEGNLLNWQGYEGGIPMNGSAYRAPNGDVVWIDPPDPGSHEAELLKLGRPQHILVTFRDHDRAVAALASKFGAKVWIPRGHGGSIEPVDEEFGEDTPLPAGLQAVSMPAMGYGEHALVTEAYGKHFAFIGDALFNLEGMRFPPLVRTLVFKRRVGPIAMKRIYRGGDTAAAPEQIVRLLDLHLDALFFSHGNPIPTDADRWIRACLGEPPRPE